MGVVIYSFYLNTLPKMAYGVLECDIVVTELCTYDFVIKDFVMKRGVICARPCLFLSKLMNKETFIHPDNKIFPVLKRS